MESFSVCKIEQGRVGVLGQSEGAGVEWGCWGGVVEGRECTHCSEIDLNLLSLLSNLLPRLLSNLYLCAEFS